MVPIICFVLLFYVGTFSVEGIAAVPGMLPCREWTSCGETSCTTEEVYQRAAVFNFPCSISQHNVSSPSSTSSKAVCTLLDGACNYTEEVLDCRHWRADCADSYRCASEQEYQLYLNSSDSTSVDSCAYQLPSEDAVCTQNDGECQWYDPCRAWQGVCYGAYLCGSIADFWAYSYGPTPVCLPPGLVQQVYTVPPGKCVLQNGTCAWSECMAWLDHCGTSWQCGTKKEYEWYQIGPTPSCSSPLLQQPEQPGECKYDLPTGTCKFSTSSLPVEIETPTCSAGQIWSNCGTRCPLTCDNYENPDIFCIEGCATGCFCPEGMVLNGNECVLPANCPIKDPCSKITCATGYVCRVYVPTNTAYCEPTCSPSSCEDDEVCRLVDSDCAPGVPCPLQIQCLPAEQVCPPGKIFDTCGTPCRLTCDNFEDPYFCLEGCATGCFCPEGMVENGDECVLPADCPAKDPCSKITCATGFVCRVYEPTNTSYCEPTCELSSCGDDEVCRLVDGDCEPNVPCPKQVDCYAPTCPPGKIFDTCGTPCRLTCDNFEDPNFCIQGCATGCFCPEGMVENGDECVLPADCPAKDPCSTITCETGYVCRVHEPTNTSYCEPTCEPSSAFCRDGGECRLKTNNCKPDELCPLAFHCATSEVECTQASCAEGRRCLVGRSPSNIICLPSCFVNNGGCDEDQICITTPTASPCKYGLEPCSTVKCIDYNATENLQCQLGWTYSTCGKACAQTCETYLAQRLFDCPTLCAEGCFCPEGFVSFRDRCVDPLECWSLLNGDPPPIDPLPLPSNTVLLEFVIPNVTREVFDDVALEFFESVQLALSRDESITDVQISMYDETEGDTGLTVYLTVSIGESSGQVDGSKVVDVLNENNEVLSLEVTAVSNIHDDPNPSPSQSPTVGDTSDSSSSDSITIGVAVAVAALLICCAVLTIVVVILILARRRATDTFNFEKPKVQLFKSLEDVG